MCNCDIRAEAKSNRVYLYDIADRMGISEPTMTRLLRKELPDEKKEQIKSIIAELASERKEV